MLIFILIYNIFNKLKINVFSLQFVIIFSIENGYIPLEYWYVRCLILQQEYQQIKITKQLQKCLFITTTTPMGMQKYY